MTEAVQLVEQSKSDLVTIPEGAIEVMEASLNAMKRFVSSQLNEGQDYGTIPGSRKPSLWKPGAEKLCRIFALGSRIVNKNRIVEDDYVEFDYTIEVFRLRDGQTVSQCEGSANCREKKYQKQDAFDILNTLKKMAQKRAFVGAVLLGTGASDYFTQDLEDMNFQGGQRPTKKQGEGENYVVQFGKKFKGKVLRDIPSGELVSFLKWLEAQGNLKPFMQEFLDTAKAVLEARQKPAMEAVPESEKLPFEKGTK